MTAGHCADQARPTALGRHLLAALDHGHGVVLGHVDVEAKTNEIPLFTTLLDRIGLARGLGQLVKSQPMRVPAPIRMVALDLDGTALNSAGVLTPRTESSLRRITAASVQVVAATGRSPSIGLRQICRKELFRWAVCSNGASLHDVERDALVSATTIPEPALNRLLNQVTAALPRAVLAWGTVSQIQWTRGFASVYGSMLDEQRIMAEGTRRPSGVVKVLVGDAGLDGTELAGLLTERLGSCLQLTASNLGYVEIVAFGVTKAARMAELCQRLSISACEAVAFGDGLNDLEMLQWAGRSYAMLGAHPAVSAAAHQRTRFSNDQDGVADILDELFPPGESVH